MTNFDISYYLSYNLHMKRYEWSAEKDALLKDTRNVSFEDVVEAIQAGRIFSEYAHPNKVKYPHQRMFIVHITDYVYRVPYVKKDEDTLFFKTIIPDREQTKRYLRGGKL